LGTPPLSNAAHEGRVQILGKTRMKIGRKTRSGTGSTSSTPPKATLGLDRQ
jgi:hypothetical protein